MQYINYYAGNLVDSRTSNQDRWNTIAYSAPVASLAVFLIVSFVVVLGCLCRQCHRKKTSKNLVKSLRPSVTYKKPDHIYDEIDTVQPKQELGTKKNEAYYSTIR